MGEPYTTIRIDRSGSIAEVVLCNPGRLNAMGPTFFHEVRRAFQELGRDREIRTVLLWAEGRLFSAGLDFAAVGEMLPEPGAVTGRAAENRWLHEVITDFQSCFTAVQQCRKPVIAAVHGRCIGGGMDLVTACDIRLCSADASFSVHETKMAMVADLGTLQRLTPIVGKGLTREMAFTGKPITAERALRSGLVNEVYPHKDALLLAARELAREIAANSPLAVQGAKTVLEFSDEHTVAEGLEFVAQWNACYFRSQDLEEALAAFREKREPIFRGV